MIKMSTKRVRSSSKKSTVKKKTTKNSNKKLTSKKEVEKEKKKEISEESLIVIENIDFYANQILKGFINATDKEYKVILEHRKTDVSDFIIQSIKLNS